MTSPTLGTGWEGVGDVLRTRATAASRWSLLRVSSIAGIAIALAGCSENMFAGDSEADRAKVDFEVSIWTDPGTGCQYLNWRKDIGTHAAAGSLSIRYRRNGTPDCPTSASDSAPFRAERRP